MSILDAPGLTLTNIKRRTRRAGFALSTPTTATATATFTEAQIRILLKVPVTSLRWRLHVHNWQPRNGTTIYAGSINFTGVWIGETAYTSGTSGLVGRPTGAFATTPTRALTAFSTAADGSEFISSWISDPTAQLQSGHSHLISYGFTKSAGSIAAGLGTYSFITTTAGASNAASVGAAGIASGMAANAQLNYFDSWIEYEWIGSDPVGLVLGDSLTAGFGQGSANNFISPIVAGNDNTQTWPAQLAMLTGSPITSQGISGLTLADIPSATNPVYTKWTHINEGFIPDYAVLFLGSNDIGGNQALSSTNQNFALIIANLRAIGIPRIFCLTIPPRIQLGGIAGADPIGHGSLATAITSGTTSIITDCFLPINSGITIDYAMTSEEKTVTTAASTGTGPYTTSINATTNAHPAGATVIPFPETLRRQFNAWLRRKPYGIDGVISIDRQVSETDNSFALHREWAASDGVHITAGGYAVIAQEVAPMVIALKV
jgi:lysophospholipase L1-like esterase